MSSSLTSKLKTVVSDGQIVPVGIFWDIENCQVPYGKSAGDVIDAIREKFINELNCREFEFHISCDVSELSKDILNDLDRKVGIFLVHVIRGKNAADYKLAEGMQKFVDTISMMSTAKPVVVLISGDRGFGSNLHGLKRRGVPVILLYNQQCPSDFRKGWDETYSWETFCSAVPSKQPAVQGTNTKPGSEKGKKNKEKSEHMQHGAQAPTNAATTKVCEGTSVTALSQTKDQDQRRPSPERVEMVPNVDTRGINEPTRSASKVTQLAASDPQSLIFEIVITGLPGKMEPQVIQDELQTLATDVDGQVLQVDRGQAFVTFKTKEAAEFGVKFFEGKVVCGCPLKALFSKRRLPEGVCLLMVQGLPGPGKVPDKQVLDMLKAHVSKLKGNVLGIQGGQAFVSVDSKNLENVRGSLNSMKICEKNLTVTELQKVPANLDFTPASH